MFIENNSQFINVYYAKVATLIGMKPNNMVMELSD